MTAEGRSLPTCQMNVPEKKYINWALLNGFSCFLFWLIGRLVHHFGLDWNLRKFWIDCHEMHQHVSIVIFIFSFFNHAYLDCWSPNLNKPQPFIALSVFHRPPLSSVKAAAICSLIPLFFIHDPILSLYNSLLFSAPRVAFLSCSSFIKSRGKPPLYRLSRGGEGMSGRERRTVDGWRNCGLPLQGGCSLAELGQDKYCI